MDANAGKQLISKIESFEALNQKLLDESAKLQVKLLHEKLKAELAHGESMQLFAKLLSDGKDGEPTAKDAAEQMAFLVAASVKFNDYATHIEDPDPQTQADCKAFFTDLSAHLNRLSIVKAAIREKVLKREIKPIVAPVILVVGLAGDFIAAVGAMKPEAAVLVVLPTVESTYDYIRLTLKVDTDYRYGA